MQIRPLTGITLKTVVVDNIAQKIGEEDTVYHFVNGGWEKNEKDEFFDFNIDDYRYGSIFVPNSTCKIRKGDRIAEALIKPVIIKSPIREKIYKNLALLKNRVDF
ncbi:hypothetical protein [Bacillus sp. JFL15]|uniref:hypothetical protein n=1 Tax=Bacillus sp. JFL15 TaxID=1679193 RepID=UPI00066FF847|nr:hypothetical protein [Bacillus sp. JFL15]